MRYILVGVAVFLAAPLGAGSYEDLAAESASECMKPRHKWFHEMPEKPLTVRWVKFTASEHCYLVLQSRPGYHQMKCDAGEVVELGLRSDGQVIWRAGR